MTSLITSFFFVKGPFPRINNRQKIVQTFDTFETDEQKKGGKDVNTKKTCVSTYIMHSIKKRSYKKIIAYAVETGY